MSKTPVALGMELTGMKGETLAEAMGISAPHLSRLKTGKSETSTKHIKRLAEICGVSETEFYAMMSGDTRAISDASAKAVAGVPADEKLLIDPHAFRKAYKRAKEIENELLGGRGSSRDFAVILHEIYQDLIAEKD